MAGLYSRHLSLSCGKVCHWLPLLVGYSLFSFSFSAVCKYIMSLATGIERFTRRICSAGEAREKSSGQFPYEQVSAVYEIGFITTLPSLTMSATSNCVVYDQTMLKALVRDSESVQNSRG